MAWTKSNKEPFNHPMWQNSNEKHWILHVAPHFLLYEWGKKGHQGIYNTLEEAQAAAP